MDVDLLRATCRTAELSSLGLVSGLHGHQDVLPLLDSIKLTDDHGGHTHRNEGFTPVSAEKAAVSSPA